MRYKTIVFVGDSMDSHLLEHLCITYNAKGLRGWAAYVRSHHMINYCILPSGLAVVQIYILRSSHDEDHRKLDTLHEFFNNGNDTFSHKHFDGVDTRHLRSRDQDISELMTRKPDLLVLSSNFWNLHHFVSIHSGEKTPEFLPESYIQHFIETTKDLVHTAISYFPATRPLLHTSIEIQTDCQHGHNSEPGAGGGKIWGRRAYVAQLNAAVRFVSRDMGVELVDHEIISKSFQPAQLTIDGVHPKAWFSLEMLNIYLNIA